MKYIQGFVYFVKKNGSTNVVFLLKSLCQNHVTYDRLSRRLHEDGIKIISLDISSVFEQQSSRRRGDNARRDRLGLLRM